MRNWILLGLLILGGTVACGEEGAADASTADARVIPPRMLLEVRRPAEESAADTGLEELAAGLPAGLPAGGMRIVDLAGPLPDATTLSFEGSYRPPAEELARRLGLAGEQLVEAAPGTTEAALVLSLGGDFNYGDQTVYPGGAPVIPPEELSAAGYGSGTVIYVRLSACRATLFVDGQPIKTWTVAIGKPSSPTPPGEYHIIKLKENPSWSWEGKVYPPGDPENGLGTRWIGIDLPTYGMHGTNEPESIGQALSHGCVRSLNRDIEEVFTYLHLGDTVIWAE